MEKHRLLSPSILLLALCFFLAASAGIDSLTSFSIAAEPNEVSSQHQLPKDAVAAVIPCKGMIDDGLYRSIQRRTQLALDAGATYLIYEIGTYGGLVKSADDISKYFILDIGK